MSIVVLGRIHAIEPYEMTSAYRISEEFDFEFRNTLKGITADDGYDDDILVRYGVSSFHRKERLFAITLNKSFSIDDNVNKLRSLRIMKEHGVKVPVFIYNVDRLQQIDNIEFPFLGRRLNHSRGTDITWVNTLDEMREAKSDYFVKYIPSVLEYRAHIFNNKCIRLSRKSPMDMECDDCIRSFPRGWELRDNFHHDYEIEHLVIEESKKAINSLELDFGGVDVIVGCDQLPYILEVNTSPHLNKYGRQVFAYHLMHLLNEDIDINQECFSRLRHNENNELGIEFREIRGAR